MRAWLILLSGLLIWTGHFFGVYIAASLFPGTGIAKWLTGLLTLIALALLVALGLSLWTRPPERSDDVLPHWLNRLTLLGGAVAAVAILYQGLPALLA